MPALAASAPILRLDEVGLDFVHEGAVVPVLRAVSLAVREGELVCLIGRSGCGKSTLLKLVAGFLAPSRG